MISSRETPTSQVSTVLTALRERLVPLVAAIVASERQPEASIVNRHFPREAQQQFGHAAALRAGFEFNRGRLDVTAHPFCSRRGPARLPHHHALRRTLISTAPSSAFCTKPGTAFTIRACGRGIRSAAGRRRIAGHSRIAIANVGKPRRPQPAVLGLLLSRGASRVPGGLGRCAARRILFRDQRRAALVDSRRSRRGDLQPTHPDSLRVGTGAARRRLASRRSARRLERKISTLSWHHARRTMPRGCCKTSTGARA